MAANGPDGALGGSTSSTVISPGVTLLQNAAIVPVSSGKNTVGSFWPPHSRVGSLGTQPPLRRSLVYRSLRSPSVGAFAANDAEPVDMPSGSAAASSAYETRA